MIDLTIFEDKYTRFLRDSEALLGHSNELTFLSFFIFFFSIYLADTFLKIHNLSNVNNKNLNKIKKNDVFIFAAVNFLLLSSLVVFFPINVPFVDDWTYLNNNYYNNNFFSYSFAAEGNHSFLIYKILGYIDYSFLHFSQQFFNFFAVLLLGATTLIFLRSDFLERKNDLVKLIFIAILFSPKQIINITQSVNLVWLFFLFFTSVFVCSAKSKGISVIHSLSIIFSPLSIGSGLCVAVYAFFTNIIQREKKNFFYVFSSVISLFVILYIFPKFSDYSAIKSSSFVEEFNTHFSLINLLGLPVVIANIFAPPHYYFYPLPMLIGAFQLIILIRVEFNNWKSYEGIKKFFVSNPLIIIGLMSAVLLIFFRHFPDYLAARYSTISIIFQLGFLLWFFKNRGLLFFKKIFIYAYILCYFLSWFLPYEGFFHHLSKFNQSVKVESCYKNAIELGENFNLCNEYAYKIVFYGGTWYDKISFIKSIAFLHDNNLNFFYNISEASQNSMSRENK